MCWLRNPYNPQAVTRYELNPDMVDLIGFCTKNPAPMLPKMDLLRSYGQYWFVTITPYGPEIEPHVPPKETVLCDFVALSEIVGPDSIGWRYDPIFLSDTYTVERHIQEFTRMAAVLAGHTHTCVISFIDLYEKVRRNFPQVQVSPVPTGSRWARLLWRLGGSTALRYVPVPRETNWPLMARIAAAA